MKRGALIVIEGIDRTGKSTQCKALGKPLFPFYETFRLTLLLTIMV